MKHFLFCISLICYFSSAKASSEIRQVKHHSALVGYHLITSWVPFKWSAAYSYTFNQSWTLEAEFKRGSWGIGAFGFDVASVTDTRYSIIARKFVGNSFHFIFGAFKSNFEARLGSDYFEEVNGPGADYFRVEGIGVDLGIGNRWQWENGLTLGIDWFRLNTPLVAKKVESNVLDRMDESDASRVKDWIRRVRNVPTFVFVGANIGYSF